MFDMFSISLDATRAELDYRHAAAAAVISRPDGDRQRRWLRRRLAHRGW